MANEIKKEAEGDFRYISLDFSVKFQMNSELKCPKKDSLS